MKEHTNHQQPHVLLSTPHALNGAHRDNVNVGTTHQGSRAEQRCVRREASKRMKRAKDEPTRGRARGRPRLSAASAKRGNVALALPPKAFLSQSDRDTDPNPIQSNPIQSNLFVESSRRCVGWHQCDSQGLLFATTHPIDLSTISINRCSPFSPRLE